MSHSRERTPLSPKRDVNKELFRQNKSKLNFIENELISIINFYNDNFGIESMSKIFNSKATQKTKLKELKDIMSSFCKVFDESILKISPHLTTNIKGKENAAPANDVSNNAEEIIAPNDKNNDDIVIDLVDENATYNRHHTRGKILWFSTKLNYGFIQVDGTQNHTIFVHKNHFINFPNKLHSHQFDNLHVTFTTRKSNGKRTEATNVSLTEPIRDQQQHHVQRHPNGPLFDAPRRRRQSSVFDVPRQHHPAPHKQNYRNHQTRNDKRNSTQRDRPFRAPLQSDRNYASRKVYNNGRFAEQPRYEDRPLQHHNRFDGFYRATDNLFEDLYPQLETFFRGFLDNVTQRFH